MQHVIDLVFRSKKWAIGGCFLALFGLVYSKFLLSVASLFLFSRVLFVNDKKDLFHSLVKNKAFLFISGSYLIYIISGLWTEDLAYLIDRLNIKLPIFGIPIAFLAIKEFTRHDFDQLFYFFFWLVVLTCLGMTGIALYDLEQTIELYKKGQIMPVPVNHIRFSLMIVFCICLGHYFYQKGYYIFRSLEDKLVAAASFFLILFLHFFAVRSGLLALYLVFGYLLLRQIFVRKNYLLGIGLAVLLSATLAFSYKFVPTFYHKIGYTIYSINLFKKKENLRDLSDSRRFGSIYAGIEISKNNPWFGVGTGDILNETNEFLKKEYPGLTGLGLMPHNQFLWWLTACGLVGLTGFLISLAYPFFVFENFKNPLFVSFNIIILSSFLTEHTLETQVGVALYVFVISMFLRAQMKGSKTIV